MSTSPIYAIDPKRALPATAYRDPTIHQIEMERVWRTDWVWVGTADQVAEPGDHFPVDVGGQSVIVLRRQDGRLAAMSNLCAHRGTLLVDEPGQAKRFQCPYHAWTYRDDGSLMAVPYSERDEIDRDGHGLASYRAEAWHGLVFVSMNRDVSSLHERFAHLEPVVAPHALDQLHHWTAQRETEEWAATGS